MEKHMRLKQRGVLATTVVSALMLAGCGGSSAGGTASGGASGGATKSPYVIGFNDDLSGPISFAGLTNLAGVQTYFDYVNKEKGGVNGHPITLKTLDSKADGATAISNVKSLVEEKALAILGNSASSAWVASGTLADSTKVPQMGYGNADKYFQTYDPYMFKNGMLGTQQAELLAQVVEGTLLKGKSGLKVAILASDTASGPLHIAAVKEAAAKRSWTIVETQNVKIGATDCTAQAAKLAASKPDVIMSNVTSVGEDIICFKQLTTKGYGGPVVNTNSSAVEATYKTLANKNWVSLRQYNWWQDATATGSVTMRARAKTYGHDSKLGAYSSDGYVAATAIEAALLTCGDDCTGEKVQAGLEGLRNVDTGGIAGPAFGFEKGDRGHTVSQARAFQWDAAKGQTVPITDWLCVAGRTC
jgi:branched-chain amino acid transport system substrate-binding protein